MRARPNERQELQLEPNERELLKARAKLHARYAPRSPRPGRPSEISAYVMHLVREEAKFGIGHYTQRTLSLADTRARSQVDELSIVDRLDELPKGERPPLHRASWAHDIARRVAPKDGNDRHRELVDRWTGYDWLRTWLPARHGLAPSIIPHPSYFRLINGVWRDKRLEDRPVLFSVGNLDYIRSGATYNWRDASQ